ncbi:MAG: histidine kinase [Bacteroidota bacterium]
MTLTAMQRRAVIISIHLVFWIAMFGLLLLIYHGILNQVEEALVASSVNILGIAALVYIHLFWLMPRWLDRKKYIAYGVGVVALLVIIATLRFYVGWEIVKAWYPAIQELFTPTYFGSLFVSSAFFLLITIPLRLVDNWLKKRALEKELKTHQLEAELRFLKAQVNPHFLFNALNNIYALSFTASKKAPEMILRLSDMMSYMLYDCKQEKVNLASEIAYLNNYIDLQQLKKDGEFNIDFEVKGETSHVFITPMLFIPLFENVFKHGNLDDTTVGWLKSKLEIQDQILTFTIANSKRAKQNRMEKGGVGLDNLSERLKLLFPNRHQLTIEHTADSYNVLLKINLQPNELQMSYRG